MTETLLGLQDVSSAGREDLGFRSLLGIVVHRHHFVDQAGVEVGLFVSTQLAAMAVGTDVVLTVMDAQNRTFFNAEPVYYYASTNCTGVPLMYADLLRFGSVYNGTLYYPQGTATAQAYGSSLESGFCFASPGFATFAPMGSTPVSQLQAPFSVVR
jgi:hypothetical protein